MEISLGDTVLFHSLFEDHKDETVLLIQVFYPFQTCQDIKGVLSHQQISLWLFWSLRILWSCVRAQEIMVFYPQVILSFIFHLINNPSSFCI